MNKRPPTVSNLSGDIKLMRLICLVILLCCLVSQAASASQYDVEVIVFRNLGAHDDGEQWSAETPHGDGFARDTFSQGLENLPDSQFTLNDVAGALLRSGAYQMLAHRLWRQDAYDQREAVPYLLHTDGAGGANALNGSITLIRERYLHLAVDLTLDTAGSHYRLDETRRIRSGELHYFDSPQLGVIARVTPYGGDEPELQNSSGTDDTSAIPDEEADTAAEPATEPN
jgi:hypothetical protein